MQNSCSIILPCPGQYEPLWTHEKGRKTKEWCEVYISILTDDQNFLESDREVARLLKYACLAYLILHTMELRRALYLANHSADLDTLNL